MKASEIRDLTEMELAEKLSDLKAELFNLRFQHAINQLENPMRLHHVKKDIARVKTIIRQREISAADRQGEEYTA
jgi:large subunit ribosomal protein L29